MIASLSYWEFNWKQKIYGLLLLDMQSQSFLNCFVKSELAFSYFESKYNAVCLLS